jgi:hypothetical protein
VLEITLCLYENGTIFYQFLGLGGAPAQPAQVHGLLTQIAQGVANGAREAALHPPPVLTTAPAPHLFPEEVLA